MALRMQLFIFQIVILLGIVSISIAQTKQEPLNNKTLQGEMIVIRGGGWHSGPFCNRVNFRNALPANWLDINVGFRCAKDLK